MDEKPEIFLEKKISKAKNLNLKLNLNERNISPIKVMSYKGIIHPYSYKMMNLNKKNQANKEENNSSSLLCNALTVQNLHKKVMGNNNIEKIPNTAQIVFENIDLKQTKRPTTSRWNSNYSNLSHKLNNQYNNNNANEKNKNLNSVTSRSKVNNVYFNKYIDIQFKPSNVYHLQKSSTTKLANVNPNISNRDESYNFVIPTANDRFSNDRFASIEKKNVNIFYYHLFYNI